MGKKVVVVMTKKFGYITGFISAVKRDNAYEYTMIDYAGTPHTLGLFTSDQLTKVKRIEEDGTYDYTSLI